jgi:uncharacterized protein with GYD domain
MALYLQLVKFTPTGAAAVLSDGFDSRAEEVARVVESTSHGKIRGFWYVADGDWHVASIIETDANPSELVRGQFHQTSSGAVEAVRTLRLVEGADVEGTPGPDWDALKEHLT